MALSGEQKEDTAFLTFTAIGKPINSDESLTYRDFLKKSSN